MTNPNLEIARSLIDSALEAVDPERCVRDALEVDGDRLRVCGARHRIRDGVVGLAIGKAAQPMLRGLASAVGGQFLRGLAVGKHSGVLPQRCAEVIGDHPFPGQASFLAAVRAEKFVRETGSDELLVVLLSGGGSSLMTAPTLDLSIEKVAAVTEELMRAGVDIQQMNAVRRRLDRLKGGGLGAMANGRPVALVLSDVVGDELAAIASGPFVEDPTTAEGAAAVLEAIDFDDDRTIAAVHNRLPRSPVPTPHHIIGNVVKAVDAAADAARERDLSIEVWDTALTGEARTVGAQLAKRLCDYDGPRPAAFVAGGETTVTVTGDGLGGRNLELALGAVETLAGCDDALLLSFATDGEDGPTDAAGAWVDGRTLDRAHDAGLDPRGFLRRNDAYHFFEQLGSLIKSGPTGTNVNDLVIGIRG